MSSSTTLVRGFFSPEDLITPSTFTSNISIHLKVAENLASRPFYNIKNYNQGRILPTYRPGAINIKANKKGQETCSFKLKHLYMDTAPRAVFVKTSLLLSINIIPTYNQSCDRKFKIKNKIRSSKIMAFICKSFVIYKNIFNMYIYNEE